MMGRPSTFSAVGIHQTRTALATSDISRSGAIGLPLRLPHHSSVYVPFVPAILSSNDRGFGGAAEAVANANGSLTYTKLLRSSLLEYNKMTNCG